jgi:hypothetical protein
MTFQVAHGHCCRVNGKVKKSLTYQSWSSMNDRCYIESHRWFRYYGGEGVEVCERWRRGTPGAFANFLADMGERPGKHMTLDRWPKTHTKNYQKDNCRWADKKTQTDNREFRPKRDEGRPLKSIEDELVDSVDGVAA